MNSAAAALRIEKSDFVEFHFGTFSGVHGDVAIEVLCHGFDRYKLFVKSFRYFGCGFSKQ